MQKNGFLNGQILIAMPGMADERFRRSVVYICAHSEEGAMGIVLNQMQSITFPDLMMQLGLIGERESLHLPHRAWELPVRRGGPVDQGRGFVLHSNDYHNDSTMPIAEDICLTATVDVLHAIANGQGPRHAVVALGYAGWGEGQLEGEISDNDWLVMPMTHAILFEEPAKSQYDRCLALIGVDPCRLVNEIGHA